MLRSKPAMGFADQGDDGISDSLLSATPPRPDTQAEADLRPRVTSCPQTHL